MPAKGYESSFCYGKAAKMFAQTGNREQALIGVGQQLAASLAGEVAAGQRRDQRITQLEMRARGIAQTQGRNGVRRGILLNTN